jgi:glycosyltransferase 2 family protein
MGETLRALNGMGSRFKKIALTALQIAITAGVLYWLFRDPRKRAGMALALSQADQLWILIGILAYGAVEVVAGWRWEGLLRVQGIRLGRPRLLMLLLIGVFFNFFIPGGTGGDVVKIFYLLKEAPGKGAAAVLSVLVDRIVGLFALILMAGAFMALHWHWLTSTPETAGCVWLALLILGASTAAVAFSFLLTGFGLVHRLPPRFPARDRLAELALAYNLYGRAWQTSLKALALSFVSHFGYFFTFFCAARAFGAETIAVPTYGQLCVIMPLINTITALPISLGGLGVREGLFQVFLSKLTPVDEAVAVLISSTGFLMTAAWGVLGGLLYLFYRPSDHRRLAEINREVADLEHHVAEDEMALELAEEIAEETADHR